MCAAARPERWHQCAATPYQSSLEANPRPPCDQRPLRSNLPTVELIAQPPLDPERAGHRLPPEKARAAVAAGTLDPCKADPPTSKQLKAWAKEHESLSPSEEEAKQLALRLLGSASSVEQIHKYFSNKRLERFLKAEEQRVALADPTSGAYLQFVVLRIVQRAAESIAGIASPFGAHEYRMLLSDSRIDLSAFGSTKEMAERIFENRHHIINMLRLNSDSILSVPTDGAMLVDGEEDDPLTCSVCGSGDASEANPIVKCDGEHETEVGTHLECMDPPLDGGVPEDAWFCVKCQQNSVYQVKAVVAKDPRMKRLVNGQRTGKACVHYKIEWAGEQWAGHDTWEALESLQQPRVKEMVSAFNKRARRV